MSGWTQAQEFFREFDDERERVVEIQHQDRLAAIRIGGLAPDLRHVVWTNEELGDHRLGLLVQEGARVLGDLWYAQCRCGWQARQGYRARTEAVSHWRTHAELAVETVEEESHEPAFEVRIEGRSAELNRWWWACSCGRSSKKGWTYREDAARSWARHEAELVGRSELRRVS